MHRARQRRDDDLGGRGAIPADATPTAPPPTLGTVLEHDALDRTNPVPVGEVNFKVVNASTQRNHAKAVATMFTELGLKQAADPATTWSTGG